MNDVLLFVFPIDGGIKGRLQLFSSEQCAITSHANIQKIREFYIISQLFFLRTMQDFQFFLQ